MCSGIIVISNVFLGMVSKQLVDTCKPSCPCSNTPAADFVQNMSIPRSCFNHVIYLKWNVTLPCAILEKLTIAHTLGVRKFSTLPYQYESLTEIRA